MKTEIALIHTTPLVLEPVQKALDPLRERYHFFHMLDEAVLIRMMKDGNTGDLAIPWLAGLVENAFRGGAEGIIVTCSSLSPWVREIQSLFEKPVLRIDEVLYHHVFSTCSRPAVLMTNPTNEFPARVLTEEMKALCGLQAEVPFIVCKDAFKALQNGDQESHDREVAETIARLSEDHDGIILSQISIERVRNSLPPDLREMVYSSLDFIKETLANHGLQYC